MDDSSLASDGSKEPPAHVAIEKRIAKMRPAQFVHLSYDYMCNGSLDSALKLMYFAESKEYGNNILILLHSWSLSRAMGNDDEADSYFNRACAVIATAERCYLDDHSSVFEGSKLEVYGAYLICISIIYKQEKSIFKRTLPSQRHSIVDAMLIEAMYLKEGQEPKLDTAKKWFSSYDIWIQVADNMFKTDFVLLAEDAYWEAFLRRRHDNYPIMKIIEIKQLTHREDTCLGLILGAYKISPQNWYMRSYLRNLEETNKEIDLIIEHMDVEDRAVTKIQSVSRMRKHFMRFEIKKSELKARKKKYQQLMQKTVMMGVLSVKRNQHRLYLIWREIARESRQVKVYYKNRLVKYIRNYMVWLRYYRNTRRKAKIALKYIAACQVRYDFTRLQHLHIWKDALENVLYTRATETIKFMLRWQKRHDSLNYHLQTTTQIGFKRRKKLFNKYLAKWKCKYVFKTRARAAAIIRMIVRNVLARYHVKQKKLKLETASAAVKELIMGNKYQLVKRRWVKWRKLYKRNRKIWAISTLAKHIPLVLARQRDRVLIHHQRKQREFFINIKYKKLYYDKESVFHFWSILRNVCQIQRMARLKIARINLERRRLLISTVNAKHKTTFLNCLKRHWLRWKVYVIIWKETENNSASLITLWWARIHFSRKAVKARKHMKGSRILATTIFKIQIKAGFRRIGRSVEMIKQFIGLNKCYASLRTYYLRVAMAIFKEFNLRHTQIRNLIHLTVHKKLGRIFYPGAHLSVHISPVEVVPMIQERLQLDITQVETEASAKVGFTRSYKTTFNKSRGGETPFLLTIKEIGCDCGLHDTALEWEHYVRPKLFAMSSFGKYQMMKAFQILMASYRIRVRRLRSLSFMLAEDSSRGFLRTVSLRCASAHTIQRSWRCVVARMKLAELIRKNRRLSEMYRKMTALKPKRRMLFYKMKSITDLRYKARLRLQTWVRMRLKRKTLLQMKINFARLVNLEALVHFKMKTNITRVIMKHLVFNYGVRSSQLLLNPIEHPASFSTSVLAENPLELLAPVINRGKGGLLKEGKYHQKFSQSLASIRVDKLDGNSTELGAISAASRSLNVRNGRPIGGSFKGSVVVPGALKSFSSPTFHEHLFNVKRSGTVVLDATKPMIEDDEIVYLAEMADVFFCQAGSPAGNHALQLLLKNFTGTKLVVFGGKVSKRVGRELCYFVSSRTALNKEGISVELKLHLTGSPVSFETVERLARVLASTSSCLSELSVDITSVGVLGLVTILAAMRMNTSVKVLIVHFDKVIPCQWPIENCFRYIAINKTLQGVYLYGMMLERDTALGLLAAVTDGLVTLTSLEFEYRENGSELSDLFRQVIIKRDIPMKVSINDPGTTSAL